MLEMARKLLALGLEATRMRDDFEVFGQTKVDLFGIGYVQ